MIWRKRLVLLQEKLRKEEKEAGKYKKENEEIGICAAVAEIAVVVRKIQMFSSLFSADEIRVASSPPSFRPPTSSFLLSGARPSHCED
ncbi:hypothetical protein H6P81_001299 [Aristolochia fimbriata]|uniref:Uncharacterized protein n=1 Tax=Aristolochia fimbriata TaxID=158543 RepID=A0AAV7F9P6_ARIFI|nr:hypothetical protein H6P81_001299 [Aristolochia fimbriata]